MHPTFSLQIRPDATVEWPADNHLLLHTPESGKLSFAALSSGSQQAFARLANGGASEKQLTELMLESGDSMGMVRFYAYLHHLHTNALIQQTLMADEKPIATITPLTRHFLYRKDLIAQESSYRLSRFAVIRRDGAKMVLETPLGHTRVTLHDPQAAALMALLAEPHTVASASEALPLLADGVMLPLFELLHNAELIAPVGRTGQMAEEEDDALRLWDFHDLFFHTRSRMGYHNYPFGGTYRGRGIMPPPPAVKANLPDQVIPLPIPDLEALACEDRPFSAVLEARRSLRQYGDEPISIAQLGEFLYRSARIVMSQSSAEPNLELTWRPWPGGGALHELEIYPVVDQCDGVPSGLYYYNPREHQLHRIAERTLLVEAILTRAWALANRESRPQICFAITARFNRLQWKYQTMAYGVILRNVGCLYQTMYLVATAMGLAPCALGGGDSYLFPLAAGLHQYEESTVGDFVLGTRANQVSHG